MGWIPEPPPDILDDLADVDISSPAHGDMVYRNDSGLWVVVGGTPSDGKVPTIQADGSVEWEAAGGSSGYPAFSGAHAYKSADQANVTDGADRLVTFDTTLYDTDSYFDNANDRFVAPDDGYYLVTAAAFFYQGTLVDVSSVIQKGTSNFAMIGALVETDSTGAMPLSRIQFNGSAVIPLNATDTVRLVVSVDSDGANNIDIRGGNSWATYLAIARIA